MYELEIYRGVMCHWKSYMTLRNDKKSEEKLTCRFKIDKRNLTNFDPRTGKPENFCTLVDFFWQKYIIFELKKYRGVIFHDTEEWCKIWRKIDLWFGKWNEKFGKLLPEHLKVLKLGLWWNPFIKSRKYMRLKFTE